MLSVFLSEEPRSYRKQRQKIKCLVQIRTTADKDDDRIVIWRLNKRTKEK